MSIWPRPVSFSVGNEVVWLSHELSYTYKKVTKGQDEFTKLFSKLNGASNNTTALERIEKACVAAGGQDGFLKPAFARAKRTLLEQRFIPWKMHKRGTKFEPELKSTVGLRLEKVEFSECALSSKEGEGEGEEERNSHSSLLSCEAYRLELNGDGSCKVYVTSVLGAVHALSTLVQLFYGHSKAEGEVYCAQAPLVIQDQPFFAHRGLNMDISRNVVNPSDVCRTITGLWLSKMNRLHIHATDSQSWPLMVPAMPELAEKGAYHESQIWHPRDLEEVQKFGQQLGVEVFLEIDLPGHTGSVYHSHPDLTLAYDKRPWDQWAVEPPAGQLKLNSPDVHAFIRKLFRDICPRVAPFTDIFHIGADELNTHCYTLEKGIESSDKTVLAPFLQRFFDVVFAELADHGLRPTMWEDILLDYPDLVFPPQATFQVWRSHDSLAKVLARGHAAVFGPADSWYLDVGLGGFLDRDPDNPRSPVKPPYPDWNPPFKNWRLVYGYDPFAGVPAEHHGKIVGGEVSCWGELTDAVNLDPMLWPRVAAAAEVLWAGPSENSEEATRRLAELRERLVLAGITAHVVQMEWSLRNKGRGSL